MSDIDLTVEQNESSEIVLTVEEDEIVLEVGSGPAGDGIIPGGVAGQVLAKNTNADYDMLWKDANDHTHPAEDISVTPVGNIISNTLPAVLTELQNDIDTRHTTVGFNLHANNFLNPHTVAHSQLADKGANDHAAIDGHIASVGNPHTVTAAQVGRHVAQWNANKIKDVVVDDAAIADGRILKFDAGTNTIVFATDAGAVPGGVANDVLGKDAGGVASEWKTILGTANEVTVTHGVGSITLSLPVAPIKRFKANTVWNGTDLDKTVDVSSSITAASEAIWQLKDNATNFEVLGVKITTPTATSVFIESNPPLPAGTYKLVGIQ